MKYLTAVPRAVGRKIVHILEGPERRRVNGNVRVASIEGHIAPITGAGPGYLDDLAVELRRGSMQRMKLRK